ncbi:helix-turn-helix transcriptional regulator [Kitasatospora sp. NA04385]|uniref:helix-turn-helix domain-containing protein n=1 Tax=Kitasatospora sp. NA04385 TaxID=2742135 RepID=UPI0015904ECB|nr:helix-turn-helix transcriptional regulator [Kitasatospora sp. NA04385]QKW23978.1 helix-turn-helix transcriptional regulator [Kitasatospora sp. NA04385]
MEDDQRAYDREVGRRVKAARLQANLTQELLAREIGVTRASVTNIEKGVQAPPPYRLVRIATALSVEPAELLPPLRVLAPTHDLPQELADMVASVERAAEELRSRDGEG